MISNKAIESMSCDYMREMRVGSLFMHSDTCNYARTVDHARTTRITYMLNDLSSICRSIGRVRFGSHQNEKSA